MIKSLVFIFLMCISQILMACDCGEFTQEYEQNNSEMIFLGKIIESNSEYYRIEVLEVFKNTLDRKDKVFKVDINSCSISPMVDEVWLIYGQLEGANLEISSCGYSKSLSFFTRNTSSKILPPRPLNYTLEEEEIVKSIHDSKVANQLYFTINSLRIKKLEEIINDNTQGDMREEIEENDCSNTYIIVLMVLNLMLLIFLIFKIRSVSNDLRAKS